MKKFVVPLVVSTVMLSGCLTKMYPRAEPLTIKEADALDCPETKIEIAHAEAMQKEIKATGYFDMKTVLAFFMDLGISNGLAKHEANERVEQRMTELNHLKLEKCYPREL